MIQSRKESSYAAKNVLWNCGSRHHCSSGGRSGPGECATARRVLARPFAYEPPEGTSSLGRVQVKECVSLDTNWGRDVGERCTVMGPCCHGTVDQTSGRALPRSPRRARLHTQPLLGSPLQRRWHSALATSHHKIHRRWVTQWCVLNRDPLTSASPDIGCFHRSATS
jgi:hypothetical protein